MTTKPMIYAIWNRRGGQDYAGDYLWHPLNYEWGEEFAVVAFASREAAEREIRHHVETGEFPASDLEVVVMEDAGR